MYPFSKIEVKINTILPIYTRHNNNKKCYNNKYHKKERPSIKFSYTFGNIFQSIHNIFLFLNQLSKRLIINVFNKLRIC